MVNCRQNFQQMVRATFVRCMRWVIGSVYLLVAAPGYKSRIFAFVFHDVNDVPRGHAQLTRTYSTNKNFIKQISLLKKSFKIIDLRRDSISDGSRGCIITFDDGYQGALEAAKTLEALEIASIHFINLMTIYGKVNPSALLHFSSLNSNNKTLWSDSKPILIEELLTKLSSSELNDLAGFMGPYLNRAGLQELFSLNHVLIGDHFLNHWHGNSLSQDELIANLSISAKQYPECQRIGPYFAAPHGQMSYEKMQFISDQGYKVIFSGTSWFKIGHTNILPRIDMNNSIKSKASLFGAIAILIIKSKRRPKN